MALVQLGQPTSVRAVGPSGTSSWRWQTRSGCHPATGSLCPDVRRFVQSSGSNDVQPADPSRGTPPRRRHERFLRSMHEDQVLYSKIAVSMSSVIDHRPLALDRQHRSSTVRTASAAGRWANDEKAFLRWLSDYVRDELGSASPEAAIVARLLAHFEPVEDGRRRFPGGSCGNSCPLRSEGPSEIFSSHYATAVRPPSCACRQRSTWNRAHRGTRMLTRSPRWTYRRHGAGNTSRRGEPHSRAVWPSQRCIRAMSRGSTGFRPTPCLPLGRPQPDLTI